MRPGDQGSAASGRMIGAAAGGQAAGAAKPTEARAAFIELYDSQYLPIVRFVMRCGASLQQAEDATQDAFLEAWPLASDPGVWAAIRNPQAWIRTSALRKYRRPPGPRKLPVMLTAAEVPEMPQPGPAHADLTHETLLVLDALRALEPKYRVIMAFHLDRFSAPEIGRELAMTDQQVRDALKKARKILAGILAGISDQERGTKDHERRWAP